MTNRAPRVLISGAGIAGPAMAFWLSKAGWDVTVVEKAPAPRRSGYMLDVRMMACAALEKMNLLAGAQAKQCNVQKAFIVDVHNRVHEDTHPHALQHAICDRHMSMMRGDLADVLLQAAQEKVRYIFGNVITAINEHADGVTVSLSSHAPLEVNCVIGADGENSSVRALVFGEKSLFEHHCGFYISAFTVPRLLVAEGTLIEYPLPGKRVTAYSIPGGKTVVEFVFRERQMLAFAPQDTATQKQILRDAFSRGEGECSRLLREMETASDFYLDAVSQIRMPAWHKGRIALIGDAAFLASPLSGQGTSLALASASILAQELRRTPHDPAAAFARYDRVFRPIARSIQRATVRSANLLLPDTAVGLTFRNALLRTLTHYPALGFVLRSLRGKTIAL